MYIERDGKKITLTESEIEAAYRIQERNYRLRDAEAHFRDYIAGNAYDIDEQGDMVPNEEDQDFLNTYGFSIEEALDESSEHYLLQDFVDGYEHCFDCNCAENDMWDAVVDRIMTMMKDYYQKEVGV